ncbi:MAG: type II secretion system F family protein [Dethiobacteria bacterium]|jgi:tight adherence protein C
MLVLVNILVFVTITLLVVAVYEVFLNPKKQVAARLQTIKEMEEKPADEDELQKPFFERIIQPAYRNLGIALGNLTPQEIRQSIEKKINYAGNPGNMNFNSFISLQALLAVLFVCLAVGMIRLTGLVGPKAFFLLILALLSGAMVPLSMLNSRVLKRQKEIQKNLPDTLDLLLVSVEAGLGFDMALKRVTEQATGVLSKEITRALEEMRMGKTREEALRGIVERTGVPDLSSFISAVIQSEQLGSNIANTLRIQAEGMRQKRRQRAEEAAMKAPIKMLFPLVFFIFPTLFVVLLGPAFIRIMQTFQGMF